MKNNAAKAALNQFKMEAASEVGVNLKQGYNGDLTAKQAGSIGGQMVNVICPIRSTNEFTYFRRKCSKKNKKAAITYTYSIQIS